MVHKLAGREKKEVLPRTFSESPELSQNLLGSFSESPEILILNPEASILPPVSSSIITVTSGQVIDGRIVDISVWGWKIVLSAMGSYAICVLSVGP